MNLSIVLYFLVLFSSLNFAFKVNENIDELIASLRAHHQGPKADSRIVHAHPAPSAHRNIENNIRLPKFSSNLKRKRDSGNAINKHKRFNPERALDNLHEWHIRKKRSIALGGILTMKDSKNKKPVVIAGNAVFDTLNSKRRTMNKTAKANNDKKTERNLIRLIGPLLGKKKNMTLHLGKKGANKHPRPTPLSMVKHKAKTTLHKVNGPKKVHPTPKSLGHKKAKENKKKCHHCKTSKQMMKMDEKPQTGKGKGPLQSKNIRKGQKLGHLSTKGLIKSKNVKKEKKHFKGKKLAHLSTKGPIKGNNVKKEKKHFKGQKLGHSPPKGPIKKNLNNPSKKTPSNKSLMRVKRN